MCVSIYNIQDLIYTCSLSYLYMYCSVTKKGSPCCATSYPFKCVGLHVVWSVNTQLKRYSYYNLLRVHCGKGGEGTGQKVRVTRTARRHRVRRECGYANKASCELHFLSWVVRSQQGCLRQCLCASRFGMSCWLKAFRHQVHFFWSVDSYEVGAHDEDLDTSIFTRKGTTEGPLCGEFNAPL